MIERYGVDNCMRSEEIKNQIRSKCLENHGVDNPAKAIHIRKKQSEIERARIAGLRSDPEWVELFGTATALRKKIGKSCLGLSKMRKSTLRSEIASMISS